MSKDIRLNLEVTGNASGVAKDFEKLGDSVGKMNNEVGKAAQGIGGQGEITDTPNRSGEELDKAQQFLKSVMGDLSTTLRDLTHEIRNVKKDPAKTEPTPPTPPPQNEIPNAKRLLTALGAAGLFTRNYMMPALS